MEVGSEKFTFQNQIDGSHIRLIQLHWGPKNSIHSRIKTFPLAFSKRPLFMTASYFCGKKLHDKPIYLQEHDTNNASATFQVYENLYPFLELLCDHQGFEPELWWWIDSICINKDQDQERGAQVRAMNQIYAAAERTIIWLGPRSIDSDLAIDFLHELVSKRDDLDANPEERVAFHSPEISQKWKAIENLLDRDWWRRVWTVQELLIPSRATFYCGPKNFRKSRFQSAVYAMALCRSYDSPLLRDNIWGPAWNRRRMLQYYRDEEPMPIVGTMAFLSDNDAAFPQDRIYALLGMVRQADREWIGEPDYKADVADVYLSFAKNHITRFKSLDIICFAHIFNETNVENAASHQRVPSWVPDWRARVRPRPTPLMVSQSQAKQIGSFRPLYQGEGEALFQAAGPSEPHFLPSGSKDLPCLGILLDYIDGIGALTDENGKCGYGDQLVQSTCPTNSPRLPDLGGRPLLDSPEVQKVIQLIALSLNINRHDKHLLRKSRSSLPSDFVAFCLAARYFPDTVQPEYLSWFQWNQTLLISGHTLQNIFETIDLFPSPTEPTFKDTLEVTLLRFLRRKEPLDAIMRNSPSLRRERIAWDNEGFLPRFHDTVLKMQRRLMVTDQGHVGMIPARATKHDVIAVLYGCSVPVVLRPLHDGTGYEFIGECYVHDYMEGEILGELDTGSKKQETFVLR